MGFACMQNTECVWFRPSVTNNAYLQLRTVEHATCYHYRQFENENNAVGMDLCSVMLIPSFMKFGQLIQDVE